MQDFTPPGPSDSRSPCPALNTLANHGILPHDGRNITLTQLVHGLEAYNLSAPVRYLLSLVGLGACGHGLPPWRTLDLADLALHGRIEHDASIVHADANPPTARYAPRDVDPALLAAFLDACPAHGMGREDLVRVRVGRERTLPKPLGFLPATLASSEAMSMFGRLKDPKTGTVSRERLQAWFGENRFPDDWHRPEDRQGLLSITSETSKFRDDVKKAREGKAD